MVLYFTKVITFATCTTTTTVSSSANSIISAPQPTVNNNNNNNTNNSTNATRVLVEKQLASLTVSGGSNNDSPIANKVRAVTGGSAPTTNSNRSKHNAENQIDPSALPPPYHSHQPIVHQHVPHQATPHTKVTGHVPAPVVGPAHVNPTSKHPKQLNFDQPTISSANKAVNSAGNGQRPVKAKTGNTPVTSHKHAEPTVASTPTTTTKSPKFSVMLSFFITRLVY